MNVMGIDLETQRLEEEANMGFGSQMSDLFDEDETAEPTQGLPAQSNETAARRSGRKRLKRDITENDTAVLHFLAKFKYANARQVGLATGRSEALAKKRLRALKSVGLVNSDDITGRRSVWFITQRGAEVLDMEFIIAADEVSVPRSGDLSYSGVGHMLAVSQVAAQVHVAMPYVLGSAFALPPLSLGQMVTDYEMDSAWKSWKERFSQTRPRPTAGTKHEKAWKQRLVTEAPKGMGVLTNRSFRHSEYGSGRLTHRPDLIVVAPNGSRIAVEVELTTKKAAEYADIMERYEENSEDFKAVVWITNNPLVKERLAGMQLKRIKVVLTDLLGVDGKPFTDSAWKL